MILKLFRFYLFLSITFFYWSVYGQISHGGTPVFKKGLIKSSVAEIKLPQFNLLKAVQTQSRTEKGSMVKLAQYAYKYNVSYNLNEVGQWDRLPDGRRVWRLAITSQGAYSLGVIFSKYHLPVNAQVFIYNSQTKRFLGAYTDQNNKKSGIFSIEPLEGDELVVEYIEPINPEFLAELEIGAILHDYKNIFNLLQGNESLVKTSGSCNVNINCPEGDTWQREKRSVCHILYGGWIASGALVNNTSYDGRPFLLTAYHAINNQADADIAVFYFNYESVDCDNSVGVKSQSISGSTLFATTSNLDFSLLELSVTPPASFNPYYAGWDRSGRNITSAVCIHHPNGDVKKISIDYDSPVTDSYSDTQYTFDPNTHWRIVEWDIGTTEGGSSGAPFFDENHRIVGDLTGGEASCSSSVNDYFAKFSESWDNYSLPGQQLKYWLDPLNSGVETLGGFDPYNGLLANFMFSSDSICVTSSVTITDLSSGEPSEYFWDFGEGANPSSSAEKGPLDVKYRFPGNKNVKLVVRKNNVADSLIKKISVIDLPVADFNYSLKQLEVSLINTSIEGMSYAWNFGDGNASNLKNPSHTYLFKGNYTVKLNVENLCGTDSFSKEIKTLYEDQLKIYPNPSVGYYSIDLSRILFSKVNWKVYSATGAVVKNGQILNFSSILDFNLKGLSAGVYILKLDIDGEEVTRKLVLLNE